MSMLGGTKVASNSCDPQPTLGSHSNKALHTSPSSQSPSATQVSSSGMQPPACEHVCPEPQVLPLQAVAGTQVCELVSQVK
jgi:hypothetical protein